MHLRARIPGHWLGTRPLELSRSCGGQRGQCQRRCGLHLREEDGDGSTGVSQGLLGVSLSGRLGRGLSSLGLGALDVNLAGGLSSFAQSSRVESETIASSDFLLIRSDQLVPSDRRIVSGSDGSCTKRKGASERHCGQASDSLHFSPMLKHIHLSTTCPPLWDGRRTLRSMSIGELWLVCVSTLIQRTTHKNSQALKWNP